MSVCLTASAGRQPVWRGHTYQYLLPPPPPRQSFTTKQQYIVLKKVRLVVVVCVCIKTEKWLENIGPERT